jgi:hypothetical protein
MSFGEVPLDRGYFSLDKGAGRELLLSSGPLPDGSCVLRFRRAAENAEIQLLTVRREIDFDLVTLREFGKKDLL